MVIAARRSMTLLGLAHRRIVTRLPDSADPSVRVCGTHAAEPESHPRSMPNPRRRHQTGRPNPEADAAGMVRTGDTGMGVPVAIMRISPHLSVVRVTERPTTS